MSETDYATLEDKDRAGKRSVMHVLYGMHTVAPFTLWSLSLVALTVRKMAEKTRRLHHRNLPLLLLQARERVISHFRPILNAHGFTEQQWRIVRALLMHGPLEPRQLCELCQISSPSIVGVLLRMEEAGLVDRERMADDQRRVLVSATTRSRQLGRRMIPAIEERYASIERLVGVETLQQAYDVLDALLAPLGYAPIDAAEGADTASDPAPAALRRRKPSRELIKR
jgi:homoprotocatechuate degradation regulator HpaR